MKFRIFILLPFFIVGILIFNYFENISLLLIIIVFCIFSSISIVMKNIVWIFIYIFFLIGGFSINLYKENINKKYEYLKQVREFEGKVVDKKDESITIKNKDYGYKIIFFVPNNLKGKIDVSLGSHILLKGKIKQRLSYRENNMASRGVNAYGNLSKILKVDNSFKIDSIPLKIKDTINNGLMGISRDSGAFVSGLITGYSSGMEEEDLDIFMDLDLIHIIAVSGFNVAVIYAVVMILSKMIDLRKRLIISFLACTGYVFITGFDPSITRAFIMISMVILGRIISKKYTTINALTSACFLMLAVNPFYLYNLGFIFSYLATLSIAIFNSEIILKIEGYSKFFKDEIATTISSTILTFPVSIYTKGYFSIISLMINALLGPIVSLITILGFVSSFIYVLIPFKMLLYPVVFIGEITLIIIRLVSKINPIVYTGQPSLVFIACYYIAIVIAINIVKFKKEFYKYVCLVSLLIIVIFQGVIFSNNLKIHFVNVGQGDSIFMEMPGRKTLLLDTGNKIEDYIVAKNKVIPYIKKLGYNKIDYLLITHFHDDHCGGVEYIESTMPVYNKITYEGSEHKDYIGLLKGDALSISGVNFDILSPETGGKKDDENENSLVFSLKYKDFSGLFTGDATKNEMDNISGKYNVFKIPHHGSKYSVSEKMLESSKIDTAVITVGNNNFGHPLKEVLDSLEKNDIKTYRTDEDGNVVYIVNSNGYKIKFNN